MITFRNAFPTLTPVDPVFVRWRTDVVWTLNYAAKALQLQRVDSESANFLRSKTWASTRIR